MAAAPLEYNRFVDKNQIFSTTFKFRENNEYIDISTWTFAFTLKAKNGATIWDITNGDFSRPDNYSVRITKSVSDLLSVTNGLYIIAFFVTNTLMTSNQYLTGQWQFND